jgi:O-antigen/teichoic acid export membrane protein
MDARLGQLSLGIWDFGWTVVGMCTFATAGIRSSVSTYVARFVANRKYDSFNDIVNSCLVLFATAGVLTLAALAAMAVFLERIFPDAFGDELAMARWTMAILGTSAALQLPLGVFNGILTGNQRYGLVNAIDGGVHIARLVPLIALLIMGMPLIWLAIIMFASELVDGFLKYLAARRIAPYLRLSARHVKISTIRFAVVFGGKDFLEAASRLLMYQAINMLVTTFMGAPLLAVFNRPMAMIQHAQRILTKMAAVFEPAASEAYARNDHPALQEMLVKGVRYSLFISLPLIAGMVVFGGAFLELWMGPNYRQGALIAVMALGNFGFLTQRTTYHILLGTGNHGRAALAMFLGAAASVVGAYVGLAVYQVGFVGLSLIIGVPFTLVNALYIPTHACWVCKMTVYHLLRRAVPGPTLAVLPFAAGLVLTYLLAGSSLTPFVFLGVALSSFLLVLTYWQIAVPPSIKDKVGSMTREVLGRLFPSAARRPGPRAGLSEDGEITP